MTNSLIARARNGLQDLWPALMAPLILIILVGAVYVPYLSNPLLFDDLNVFNGLTIYDYALEIWRTQLRWIPYATLAHLHALSDGNIGVNRMGNLLLHAGNVVAVYVLINRLLAATRSPNPNPDERSDGLVAFVAAALFAVHPVAVYGVGYLIQRPILMSTLFMLLMLISWTRWLAGEGGGLQWWSVCWYALSVFSKEHSVCAPAVALLLAFSLQKPSVALVRRLAPPMLAMALIAIFVIGMVKGLLGAAYEPLGAAMVADAFGADIHLIRYAYPLSVLTQTLLYFKYLALWLIPDVSRMSIDMREAFALSPSQWQYWLGASLFACYGLFAVRVALRGGRVGLMGWLLAYPWLLFATELAAVRIQEPFVLYRTYLWFPLFGTLIACIAFRAGRRPALVAVIATICLLLPLSWNRLTTLSDPLLAWNDAAKLIRHEDELGALRIYYNRALALSGKGRKAEALVDLGKVIDKKPELAQVRFARAQIYFSLKQFPLALEDLNAAILANPAWASAYYARGMTLRRLGRDDEARTDLEKSCELRDTMGCFVVKQVDK